MKLSPKQIKLLHWAARQAGYESDAMRHSVQLNIGGTFSAADRTWSREGFIAVMAFYEDACEGKLRGSAPGYWRSESDKATPTDTLVYHARKLAEQLGMSAGDLDRFLSGPHMTGGKYRMLADAPAYWLTRLIEALKAILARVGKDRRLQGPGTVSGSTALPPARADLPVEAPF